MSVHARAIRSTPQRSASETWEFIVGLIASASSRSELLSVSGLAASAITSEGPKESPIVVHGGGPQVRIRCLYDEDAITGEKAKEERLPRCPSDGDWHVSIPVPEEDLDWMTAALAKKSSRIIARAVGEDVATRDDDKTSKSAAATIEPEAFLRP